MSDDHTPNMITGVPQIAESAYQALPSLNSRNHQS